MDRLEPEVLKMIADALHDTVQCPVCLGPLRPPVTQCTSGHGICPDCSPHMNNCCPTCREAFIETTPIILHQLLEALPRTCQYKTLGCTEVYLPGGHHETLCSYRTVDCKLIECEWTGQSRKLQTHLLTSHTESTFSLTDDMRTDITWLEFDSDHDSFRYIPFVAYDQVFWEYIHMNLEVKKLCISFTHSANGDDNCDYYAVLTFKNGDFAYVYTIKIPSDNRANNVFIDFFEECCMTVPGNMLYKFVNDQSTLKYNVNILKEDK